VIFENKNSNTARKGEAGHAKSRTIFWEEDHWDIYGQI
jgi:hypothetical protein